MSSTSTQSTASQTDLQFALELHRTLNVRPKRSAGKPERLGSYATSNQVDQAINDGQGTSTGLNSAGRSLEYYTHKDTPRVY